MLAAAIVCQHTRIVRHSQGRLAFVRGVVCPTLLDDELVETKLLSRTLKHLFLDRVLRNETEDDNLLLLADTMSCKGTASAMSSRRAMSMRTSVHRLQVSLRIPVAIEEDDNVRRSQIDAETASARRQEEDELAGAFLVVFVDRGNPVLVLGATVDSAVLCKDVSLRARGSIDTAHRIRGRGSSPRGCPAHDSSD